LAPAIHIHLSWRARLALAVGLHRNRWVRGRLGWKVEVLEGIEQGRKSDWWQKTPLYAAICRDDPRVDERSLAFLRKRSSGKGTVLHEFESGGHVFMDQAPKEQLHEEVLNFLRG
jgi:pimeloyl-ACP methyl ester carboxylesterase